MPRYEYKIVPAPDKAQKIKGLKSPERFATTIEQVMNEMGAAGWQYLRADTLPQEERSGLASRVRNDRCLLVFQREIADAKHQADTTGAHDAAPAAPSFSRSLQDPPLTRAAPRRLQHALGLDDDPDDFPDPPVSR